jgi:hypothetical protein
MIFEIRKFMIKTCIYIYLIFSFNFSNVNDSVEVKKVIIHYIYLGTETQHNISCNVLDAYQGKKGYKVKQLTNATQINLFMDALNIYKTPPLVKNIDVRAKAYIHYFNGKVSVACIDQFGDIMLDNKFIGVSSSLLSFLIKNCEGFA